MEPIRWTEFARVELRVGTVTAVVVNLHAAQPAHVVTLDFGIFGTRTAPTGVTACYEPARLLGRQVLCVCNLADRRPGGAGHGEVALIWACDAFQRPVLARLDRRVPNGTRLL